MKGKISALTILFSLFKALKKAKWIQKKFL